jgi:protease-4
MTTSSGADPSIDELTADDHVRAVVVRINSPGGSATASEAIRQSLDQLAKKKPLVFSMGEVAASGGYWITCIGQPILAEHGTITGSIGVFSLKLSAGSLLRRVGVRVETIHLDSAAAMDSIDHAWTEEEIDRMQAFIDHIYTRFLQIGSESRKIPVDQLKGLAGGRVWSGEQAKANGLIDSIGGLDDAIAMVVKKSGAEKFKIVHRPDAPTGIDLLQLLGERDEESDVAIGAIDIPSASMETIPATILSFLRQRGFRADGTRSLLRWLERNENSMPKAWLLMPEEIRIR